MNKATSSLVGSLIATIVSSVAAKAVKSIRKLLDRRSG